jgi:hypothetical protein
MVQVKRRSDTTTGTRIMVTLCFYQDTRHENGLRTIKRDLKCGYLSRRNDGMSELRINGFSTVSSVLKRLQSHIRFKRVQVRQCIALCALVSSKRFGDLTQRDRQRILKHILAIRKENYASKTAASEMLLKQLLNLTP